MSSTVDGKMITKDHGTFQLINGTSRADLLCQKDAEQAGLWGTYSALLSTKHHPLQNITAQRYHHLPVVNTMVSGLANVFTLLLAEYVHVCCVWVQGHLVYANILAHCIGCVYVKHAICV